MTEIKSVCVFPFPLSGTTRDTRDSNSQEGERARENKGEGKINDTQPQ